MDIQFDFLNRCVEQAAPSIVIYQRPDDTDAQRLAVAWKVIRNCAPGWHHPFTFATSLQVDVSDADGNHLTALDARAGMQFEVAPLIRGRHFARTGPAVEGQRLVVRNALRHSVIHANLYSKGRLLASRRHIAPGSRDAFRLTSQLWAAVADVEEGERFDADAIEGALQISLRGIASARVVLTDDAGTPGSTLKYRLTWDKIVLD